MLLEDNYKSTCLFAEDIISYLYGEIKAPEKLRFEKHLPGCNSCADELAGLSFVRSSVLEWRTEEFLPLKTPVIVIPFEQNLKAHNLADVSNTSPTWIEQIRAFFKISPILMSTAASLAVLLVCLGLFFALSKPNNDTTAIANINTAADKNDKIEIANLPSSTSVSSLPEKSDNKVINLPKSKNSSTAVTKADSATAKNPPASAIAVKTNIIKSLKQLPNSANVAVNKVKKTNKNNRPTLSGDDDDEDSLRLSDIFDEVSLNK